MMSLIFIASSMPGQKLPAFGTIDFLVKKGGHMLGYAILAGCYFHALAGSTRSTRQQYLLAVILAFLYAVSDEAHQAFTPMRSSSAIDVGIDTTGAAIGLGLYLLIRRFRASVFRSADV
jgi:VanZ family protein